MRHEPLPPPVALCAVHRRSQWQEARQLGGSISYCHRRAPRPLTCAGSPPHEELATTPTSRASMGTNPAAKHTSQQKNQGKIPPEKIPETKPARKTEGW